MTATSHALTGAVIGLAIHNPWLAIPLAFASHFVADALPHFDFFTRGKEVLARNKDRSFLLALLADCVVALIVFVSLAFIVPSDELIRVWACSFAAVSPDLIWGWRFIGERRSGIIRGKSILSAFHTKIQWKESPAGIITELVIIFVMIIAIANLV